MAKTSSKKSLLDAYQFHGYKTLAVAKGKLGDKNARVLSLSRRSKKVYATNVANCIGATMIARPRLCAIFHAVTAVYTLSLRSVGSFAKGLA